MKTLRLIGMALFAVLMCVNFASCSDDENVIHQEPQKITVSLGFEGEINTSESPLTRVSSNDIYVVTVTYYPTGSETRTRYAYGFFSDINNVSIELYTNYTYEFSAWCFKKGMEYDSFGSISTIVNNNQEKGRSLKISDVENKFIYSTETTYRPANYEGLTKDDAEIYSNDYYYCHVSNFTPTTNSKLNFNMFRCVFGYSINVENIKSGYELKVKIGDRDQIILTSEKPSFENISHFYDYAYPASAIWKTLTEGKEFTQETTIKVTLVDSNSMEDIIAEEKITFTRNKMKNITIKLKDTSTEKSQEQNMGFVLNTEEMGNDTPLTIIQE